MHTRKHALRFISIFLFLIACLVVFSVKLVLIQIFHASYLANLAQKQHNYVLELEPKRGTIYDRKMRPLAINVAVYSLYAKPRIMAEKDKQEAVRQLSVLLNLNPEFLKDRLGRKKYFVWIARKLSADMADKVKALHIKGLDFIQESKRYYPNQSLAAHIIGFAGVDNQGLEGLEIYYDKYLKGEYGWAQILRDARQRELLIEKDFVPPKDGFNLVLTIDETIQYIAERALQKGFEKFNAKGAIIVVMNPKTGEILALANRPTYDLGELRSSSAESRTNRALAHTYEPGSAFKIVTAAAALQEGAFQEEDKIFCENGSYKFGGHILHDAHGHGLLSFREVIEQSSNIGVCKIAQKLGAQKVYEYAKRFRFGEMTGINMPGENKGILKAPSTWSKTSITAIPMGHEVTVNAIQLTTAIATIANDGVYMKPFVVKYIRDNKDELIKEFLPQAVSQAITPETAARLQDVLTGVVERGTATKAKIEGIKVAGKTGTAQKVIEGNYSHNKFYSTFIGFAPVDDPKLAVVVIFDEPHPSYYGGTVCAPVFQEVVRDSLKYMETTE